MSLEQRLNDFISWWRDNIKGDEKGEAQIFLDRLIQAFGHKGALEVGTYEERVPRKKRDGKTTVSFADYVITGKVLIEMKKRGENLANHYDQLEDYWKSLGKKPSYAILCNFDEIWIYAFPLQFYDPVDYIKIEDLTERSDALEFLVAGSNKTPVFQNNLVEVTKNAAFSLSEVFKALNKRDDIEREVAQRYVLQCMLALFSEDIGLLPSATFTRVIEDCQNGIADSYDLISCLFVAMNRKGIESAGRFYGVDYFNGGIFSEIRPIALSAQEINYLRDTARENWSKIKPAIFGVIFEDSLDKTERHQIGAHFTSEQDIKLIVDPVIVNPWDARIEAATTAAELLQLHNELCNYIVIDPACGSGNFLYIAYIEMKKLEGRLLAKLRDVDGDLPEKRVAVKQFYGFDINPFAVELAKVTLMIAKKVAVDAIGSDENPLPLDNMDDHIQCEDALFVDWPEFDACIGNPPYFAGSDITTEWGLEYANKLREAYPEIHGRADYCVHWFRKAHSLMKKGSRAGLVGTNTIRQNVSREGGLDYIVVNDGHIFDAVPNMPWSGEAVVHISIVNWSKGESPVEKAALRHFEGIEPRNGDEEEIIWRVVELDEINSALSENIDLSGARVLSANTSPQTVFEGQKPGNTSAFTVPKTDALNMIRQNSKNEEIIRPYLSGNDLVSKSGGKPSRFIIDFRQRGILEAKEYKDPFARIENLILSDLQAKAKAEAEENERVRANNPRARIKKDYQSALNSWWQHARPRPELAKAIEDKKRCITMSRVSKRAIFDFIDSKICPSDSLKVYAFDDDYSFGIIQSGLHWEWTTARGSSLKDDTRNTTTSTYDTFPWPQNPTAKQVKAVANAARTLHEFRRARMSKSEQLTLREMYRLLELPGKNPLKDLHAALDKAVMAAYGFDPKGDILSQLLTLNLEVAEKIENGDDVTAPGIPPNYLKPDELISEGCIQPPELI